MRSQTYHSGPLMSDYQTFSTPKDGVCRTLTAQSALDILLDGRFRTLDISAYYERLAHELGRDFPNIRFVARYVPLLHSGQKHRELRQQGALYLRTRSMALAAFEHRVADLVGEALSRPGQVEMVTEIITPIFEMAAQAITGLPYFPDVIRVFTTYNSLKMSRKIDADFAALRKMARQRFPQDSDETHGMRVGFSVLGVAPVGASLAQSFAAVIPRAHPVPINALPWGKHFLATALPVVGRETLGGPVCLAEGVADVRVCEVDLSRFTSEGQQPDYIFGAGPHACLGRSAALSLWGRIGAVLAQNRLNIRLLELAPASHKILDFPKKMLIEVTA